MDIVSYFLFIYFACVIDMEDLSIRFVGYFCILGCLFLPLLGGAHIICPSSKT